MHKKPDKGGGEAWSLDDVDYNSEVREKEVDPNSKEFGEGVYIRDLFLEGCGWSKTGLDEP